MRLLLVDGNAVLHRAYYALPDWRNRSGEATAGVYGFLSMLLKAISELKPTHLAVVFDHPGPTFRHLMYVGYQVRREKERQVSEDIWGQVDKLKVVFEKMGVPVYQVEGVEADDVIGTLCQKLTKNFNTPHRLPPKVGGREEGGKKENTKIIVITGDKDLMQLVNENVSLFMPQKGLSDAVLVDEKKVFQKMGVRPDQIVDYKALVGDSSDNYPGVTGIGPKTAVHLLAEYGGFEEIYKQIGKSNNHSMTNAKSIIDKLINGYESGELSKRLATIKTDVPISINNDQCQIPNIQKIIDILEELGYKSLVKRTKEQEVRQTELF
jgi:DNA polymerase-1